LPLVVGRLEQRLQSTDIANVNQHERTDMPSIIRIQDLSAEEIAALLARDGKDVTARQAVALQEFVEDIGGMENANAAVEMLSDLRNAA
jgi:hypothetical protein